MMITIRMLGWLSTILMLLLLAKFPARRLGLKKANIFLMKHHQRIYRVLIATSAIHAVLALCVKSHFSPASLGTGFFCFLLAFIASLSLRLLKSAPIPPHGTKPWLIHHRLFAAAALFFLIVHIIVQSHTQPIVDPAFYFGFQH